jgi:hypothetical protein
MQISRFGRALPEPAAEVVKAEALEHIRRLSTPFVCKKGDLASFRSFCCSAGRAPREAAEEQGRPFVGSLGIPSTSASLENSGGRGAGHYQYIKTAYAETAGYMVYHDELMKLTETVPQSLFGEYVILDETAFDGMQPLGDAVFPYKKSYEMSWLDWEIIRRRNVAVLWAWLTIDWAQLPICRQVVLAERGWKCRSVTPVHPAMNFLTTLLNDLGLRVLRSRASHPSLRTSAGVSIASSATWENGVTHDSVRSADLTAASDLLPLDLILAGWDGFAEGLGLAEPWAKIGRRSLGPHFMWHQLLDGDKVQSGSVTCRGALMGCQTTWPLLSLYLEWIHSKTTSIGTYAVVGDDYIACLRRGESARFDRFLLRTGGIPSFGKDYYFHEGYGVLCEELVHVPTGKVHGTVSVRALCGLQKGGSRVPLWSTGESLCDRIECWGEENAGQQIVRSWFTEEIESWRRLGVDPFGPRSIMGAGFPGPASTETLKLIRVAASQTGLRGRELVAGLRMKCSAAWNAKQNAATERDTAKSVFLDLLQMESERLEAEFVNILRSEDIPAIGTLNRHVWFSPIDGKGRTAFVPTLVPRGRAASSFLGKRVAFGRLFGLLDEGPTRDLNSQGYIAERLRVAKDQLRVRGHSFWHESVVDREGLLSWWAHTEELETSIGGLFSLRS